MLQLRSLLGTRHFSSFLGLRDLEADEQQHLSTLRNRHPEIDLAYDLVQQFARTAAHTHRRTAR